MSQLGWTVAGRYQVFGRIGTGGMAEVYLARDATGEWVALKQLLPHMRNDAMVVRMFLNEGRLTARIDSPHVVHVREIGNAEAGPFIAMELLQGHTLAELRERAAELGQWLPTPIALRVLADACRGLDSAHHAKDDEGRPLEIVHRDFTPDNLHVSTDGRVRVIDFGIAKAENVNAGTEPGTLKGKFFYLSPEMVLGREVDKRADVFAAGVMLYEQLCGRRPFTGMTSEEVLRSIAAGSPAPPRFIVPSIPATLEQVVMTALAQNREQRFPTLAAFVEALEATGEVAQTADVAQYLNRQFPPETDERQQLIARVKADALAAEQRAQAQLAAAQRAQISARPRPVALTPLPLEEEPARRRSVMGTVLVALLVLGGVAGGGWWYLKNQLPASARIEKGSAAATKAERVEWLAPLAGDEAATPGQLREGAELLVKSAAWEAAEPLVLAAARKAPGDGEVHLLLAKVQIQLRRGKLAEESIARAEKSLGKDPRPDVLLADLRLAQGDRSGAIEALSAAQKKKDERTTRARLGFMLSQEERLEDAERVLEPLSRGTVHAPSAAELGFVYLRQGRTSDAYTVLKRALAKDAGFARAHYYLGAVYVERGDLSSAEAEYREADRLAPREPLALAALCQVLVFQKKPASVKAVMKEIEERFPENAAELTRQCE